VFYLIFGIAFLGFLLLAAKWYSTAEPKDLIRMLKIVGLILALGVALVFVLSGKAALAFLTLPALLPWIRRIMIFRQVLNVFRRFRNPGGASPGGDSHSRAAPGTDMSREEALEVLGLEEGASEQEIKESHRRLISNVHPDLGGSTYLASKINRAKSVLLG